MLYAREQKIDWTRWFGAPHPATVGGEEDGRTTRGFYLRECEIQTSLLVPRWGRWTVSFIGSLRSGVRPRSGSRRRQFPTDCSLTCGAGSERAFHPIRCYFVAAFSRRTMVAATRFVSEARTFGRTMYWRRSQVLFGEFAKLVGNGRRGAQRHRSVSDSIPSEAIADPVDGMVGRPTCHAFFWCRGGALHL